LRELDAVEQASARSRPARRHRRALGGAARPAAQRLGRAKDPHVAERARRPPPSTAPTVSLARWTASASG